MAMNNNLFAHIYQNEMLSKGQQDRRRQDYQIKTMRDQLANRLKQQTLSHNAQMSPHQVQGAQLANQVREAQLKRAQDPNRPSIPMDLLPYLKEGVTQDTVTIPDLVEAAKEKRNWDSQNKTGGKSKYTNIDKATGQGFNTETDQFEMIPGWQRAEDPEAQAKADRRQSMADVSTEAFDDATSRAIDLIDNVGVWDTLTGADAYALSHVAGSDRSVLDGAIDTMRGLVGFEKLQAMRDASPTGGALGQVSNLELNQLNAALGTLDPNKFESAEDLKKQILRVQDMFNRVIHGPNGKPAAPSPDDPPQNDRMRELEEKYGE